MRIQVEHYGQKIRVISYLSLLRRPEDKASCLIHAPTLTDTDACTFIANYPACMHGGKVMINFVTVHKKSPDLEMCICIIASGHCRQDVANYSEKVINISLLESTSSGL